MTHPNQRGTNSKIFISYRRGDAPFHTDRLHNDLARYFGLSSLFMDVDALKGGDHYEIVIKNALASSEVFLAIIGPKWQTIAGENGVRRLDEEEDWVRVEIEAALKRPIRVIPILVQDAALPARKDLPPSLAGLVGREAERIDDARWQDDVKKLIAIIEEVVPALSPSERPIDKLIPLWKWLTAGGIAVVAALLFWLFILAPLLDGGEITAVDPNTAPSPVPSRNPTVTQPTNQQPTSNGTAAASPTVSPTVTPSPTPGPTNPATVSLANSSWSYDRFNTVSRNSIAKYVIIFNDGGTFNYRKPGGELLRNRFGEPLSGRWFQTGSDVRLVWSIATDNGVQTDKGTMNSGDERMGGSGGGSIDTPYAWEAKKLH